jgi:cell division protease FtsH
MPNQADPQQQPPRDNGGGGGEGPKPPPRMSRGAFSWIVILALGLMLLVLFNRSMNSGHEISNTDFKTHLQNGNVKSITIEDESTLLVELENPLPEPPTKKVRVKRPDVVANYTEFEKFVEQESPPGSKVEIWDKHSTSVLLAILVQTIPWLLLIVLIWFLIFRQLRQSGAGAGMLGNFGRSRHRITTKEHTHITFVDVAGVDEAKDEVTEIVEFLKSPKRFQRLGGRIPRGVLLIGEPGCGKTLLAKAIAGEADVPFFSISGSDFVEMFVGVGASRVRDLFRQAKDNSPCIVFLDEIDAVGRRRGLGYGGGGGHDEREQTLNAILVEMDGFETNDQVIVIAATNRADVLDPALVRPGRFDRQVYVPLPDVKGRFEILKVHAKNIKLQPPIESKLQRLARATPMFSGADLAAIINEAALLATLASKDAVDLEDLEEARDKIRWGRAKRSRVVEDKDRELTAYHEAGHAVIQTLLEDADPVHKVSIIPRGPYGGATFSLPEKDRMTVNRSYVHAALRVLCAGRIAEETLGRDINSGAEGDIRQATQLARRMITDWGMSDRLGFVYYGDEPTPRGMVELNFGKEMSTKTAEAIDEEVKRIIDEAYADTRRLLDENRDKLEAVAQALLKYETLDGEEVSALLRGETLDRPTVADLIAEEQARRKPEKPPVARPVEQPPDEETGALPSPA